MKLDTALAIVAPPEVQAFAAPFRERHTAVRIPAHLTLLYPFVSVEAVDEAAVQLARICSDIPPFAITLDRYGESETAIFLEPSDAREIRALFRKLVNGFLDQPSYTGESRPDLRPHLTLAAFERPDEKVTVSLPPVRSFTFTVDRLHIFLGTNDPPRVPWISRAIVHLGGKL